VPSRIWTPAPPTIQCALCSAQASSEILYGTRPTAIRCQERLIEVHIYRNMEDDVRIQVDKLNLENSINPRKKSEVDSGSPRSTNNANMGTSSNFSPFATHLRQQCSIPLWPWLATVWISSRNWLDSAEPSGWSSCRLACNNSSGDPPSFPYQISSS
jgi:hypothetical protein